MKIAQIAPLAESVPPRLYGGTERVVSYLTEELVRLGHEVTLFASGDSETRARLVACAPQALRLDPAVRDPLPHLVAHARARAPARARVRRAAFPHRADAALPAVSRARRARRSRPCTAGSTCPTCSRCYREFRDMPLVSISDSQRAPCRRACTGWAPSITACRPRSARSTRRRAAAISPSSAGSRRRSGLDRAIEIAARAGVPLRIAAKVDHADEAYFRSRIAPLLGGALSSSSARVGERDKPAFLGNAIATALPDRLAGAVRPGDDRGDGLRHAGARLAERPGARDRRSRRHRLHRRIRSMRPWRRCRAWRASTARGAPAFERRFLGLAHGAGLPRRCTASLAAKEKGYETRRKDRVKRDEGSRATR